VRAGRIKPAGIDILGRDENLIDFNETEPEQLYDIRRLRAAGMGKGVGFFGGESVLQYILKVISGDIISGRSIQGTEKNKKQRQKAGFTHKDKLFPKKRQVNKKIVRSYSPPAAGGPFETESMVFVCHAPVRTPRPDMNNTRRRLPEDKPMFRY